VRGGAARLGDSSLARYTIPITSKQLGSALYRVTIYLMKDLSLEEYRALAEFRYQIRRFLCISEEQVRTAGMEPQQHQLLLAIRGLPDGDTAIIGELAERLQLKHHSTVELVDRLEKLGYVARAASKHDRRQVIVHLTQAGATILRKLSLAHHQELEAAGPRLAKALRSIARQHGDTGRNAA
jgi:DNA-binding MarR family transcriptional regulator